MKTIFVKPQEVEHKWYLIDADGKVLGRLASRVVGILRGKNKPEFSPHWDMGDSVIIVNADKVRVTGRKPGLRIEHLQERVRRGLVVLRHALGDLRAPVAELRARAAGLHDRYADPERSDLLGN